MFMDSFGRWWESFESWLARHTVRVLVITGISLCTAASVLYFTICRRDSSFGGCWLLAAMVFVAGFLSLAGGVWYARWTRTP